MSERSRSYREGLLERLRDSAEAAEYLQAALEDSHGAFLVALKNVLDARKVAKVARSSGVSREHLYQVLTPTGNPTLGTLEKVLTAVGLRLSIELGQYAEAHHKPIAEQAWRGSWQLTNSRNKENSVYSTENRAKRCFDVTANNRTASKRSASRATILRPTLKRRLEPCYEMAY